MLSSLSTATPEILPNPCFDDSNLLFFFLSNTKTSPSQSDTISSSDEVNAIIIPRVFDSSYHPHWFVQLDGGYFDEHREGASWDGLVVH